MTTVQRGILALMFTAAAVVVLIVGCPTKPAAPTLLGGDASPYPDVSERFLTAVQVTNLVNSIAPVYGSTNPAVPRVSLGDLRNDEFVVTDFDAGELTSSRWKGMCGAGGNAFGIACSWTNIQPASWASGVSSATWTPAEDEHLRLVLTNQSYIASDDGTNELTVSYGVTNVPATYYFRVLSQQGATYKFYVKLVNCYAPGGANVLYLGAHVAPTTHLYQVYWDGEQSRLIGAGYNYEK